MIVVSDTSPINYLILIDFASILPSLFQQVRIPEQVFKELSSVKAPKKDGFQISLSCRHRLLRIRLGD